MSGSTRRYDHLVVGAGVGGCVFAGRLAEAGRRVLLLDAGSATSPPERGRSFHDALAEPGRTFADVTVTATRGAAPTGYRLGRGLGGGAAINGMLATPLRASDFDRWATEHDLPSWAWSEVHASMSRHLLPIERTDRSEWGRVDHALVEAATAAGHPDVEDAELEAIGVGSAWLTRANGSRVTPADVYVALGGSELDVRGETTVRRVLMTNGRATGVLTESGDVIDADEVTLATGAFETAAQLQRSLATDRTRCRVRDHPSIRFTLRLRDPNDPDDLAGLVAATLLRWSSPGGDGDIQVLPLNHLGSHADPHLAGLLVVLLDARSAGTLEVADDGTRASVSLGLLAADEDRRRMRAAARHVATLLGSEPFADIAEDVFVDDRGTRLADLALGDDDVLDRWMLSSVGDTYHAGSSSPMGGPADRARVVDEEGLVVGARSLRVCDASIFPDLPVANPYLPLVTVAEEIARRAIAAD